MSSCQLEELSRGQRDRLAFIDLTLRFLGEIRRMDLVSRFGVTIVSATRDFALYKKLASSNIVFNGSSKIYECGDPFKPLFSFSTEQVMTWISLGFGDSEPSRLKPVVSCETSGIMQHPNIEILSVISRSINLTRIAKIEYLTLEDGLSKREIVPFALAENEHGWSVRAFDRLTQQFMDFILTRIIDAKIVSGDIRDEETQQADKQWNRYVELEIVPHPTNVRNIEPIETEFNMTDGILKVSVRAPLAGYTLRRWNVDCSEKHSIKSSECQLWLSNYQTLYGVSNLSIVPGYESSKTV